MEYPGGNGWKDMPYAGGAGAGAGATVVLMKSNGSGKSAKSSSEKGTGESSTMSSNMATDGTKTDGCVLDEAKDKRKSAALSDSADNADNVVEGAWRWTMTLVVVVVVVVVVTVVVFTVVVVMSLVVVVVVVIVVVVTVVVGAWAVRAAVSWLGDIPKWLPLVARATFGGEASLAASSSLGACALIHEAGIAGGKAASSESAAN
mmetsp:Transcript_6890/g.16433  ORF Transcript_6890/g.16433 Transcript_6890/m.16433 type:complete len:204 (-) Transcript_6890:352-963(-)